jgi:hypothetical protein
MQAFAKDLTVTLQDDRPGVLARVFEAIYSAHVNVDGYAEVAGTLHVLTRNAAAVRQAIATAGLSTQDERDVLVLDVADRPGVAAVVFRRIADAGINVHFSYVGTNNRLVIGSDDTRKIAALGLGGVV